MSKITSYNSEIIQKNLKLDTIVDKLKNESIISLVNSVNNVKEIGVYNDETSNLINLDIKGEVFLFDCLEEINNFIKINNIYLVKKNYEKNISEEKLKRKEIIPKCTINKRIYKEVFRIFINKIIRIIPVTKIILIKVLLNDKYKLVDGKKIELDKQDKLMVKKANEYLMGLYEVYSEVLPHGNSILLDEKIYISDINELNLSVDKEFKDELNHKILEKLKNITCYRGEKIHPSTQNIRYYFEKAKIFNKDKLIIVFSAFSGEIPKYNYVNTLKLLDCNKLFILDDYGTRGTYYLGLDGNLDVETSVMSLICSVMNKYKISFDNVISVGSSKGGTAALYYGLKYNFKNIIAGAPQYKVGSYLIDLTIKDYAKDIFGDLEENNRIKYDNFIRLVINNSNSNIHILTGDGDPQYKNILKEFEYVAKDFDLNLVLDKCDIKSHGDIAKKFPEYLNGRLEEILGSGYINNNLYFKVLDKVKYLINILQKTKRKRGV